MGTNAGGTKRWWSRLVARKVTVGFTDPFSFLGNLGINKFKNIQVQKEIKKQADATLKLKRN